MSVLLAHSGLILHDIALNPITQTQHHVHIPQDYPLLGIMWDDKFYKDNVLLIGYLRFYGVCNIIQSHRF